MPFQDLHQLLPQALEPFQQNSEQQQLKQISDRWLEIVGDAIAAQTRPIALQRNTLQVAVSNSVWTQTLMFERPNILKKISDRLNLTLSDIRFSTAQWHQPTRTDEIQVDPWDVHPSKLPAQNSAIEHQLLLISDPKTAFQKWSHQVQERGKDLPTCPSCGCPTPVGELERWSVCSLCVGKMY